jgi:hypothetical protein
MPEDTDARWTWHRLTWMAPVAFGILFLLIMVTLAGGFEPFLFVIALVTLITGWVGRRFPRRAGPITVLAVMALLIIMNLPAILDDLGHPDSFWNFAVFGVTALTFALVGIIGSIAVLMSRRDVTASRALYAAVLVIIVGVVVSAVATLSLEDDTFAAGDLRVVAEEVEFLPESLSGSGTVGVFIENKDPIRHTFTIEALDIEVDLPGSTDRRIDINAAPGTYEFVCKVPGHEDMMGTLTIEG